MKTHRLAFCSAPTLALLIAIGSLWRTHGAELFPEGAVKVTDGKTTWNLKITDRIGPETVGDEVKYIVFSFHTEQFPSRFVAAHTKGIYEAFLVLSPRFPACAFVPVMVRNQEESQASIDSRVTQTDFGPTKGVVYDYIKTLRTQIKDLPPFFREYSVPYIESGTNGLAKIDGPAKPAAVFPVVVRQPSVIESIIVDFSPPEVAPRFIVTQTNGTIVRLIKKGGPEGLTEIREILPALK